MEEARCLMWSSTGKPHRTPVSSRSMYVFGDSWEEEQALADDAAVGALAGYVWPPRSYSCTFCRREFRSAQALGGHMNVHRRDRARLKQADSLQPSDAVLPPEDRACTTQMSTFSYGNPNPQLPGGGVTRVLSPPRAREISTEENTRTILCFLPQPAEENELVFSGPAASWSSLMLAGKPDREISVSRIKFKNGADVLKCRTAEEEDRVTEDAPVGLDLLVCRKQTSEDVVAGSCKRRRVGEKPSTLISTLIGGDEVDLELRLG